MNQEEDNSAVLTDTGIPVRNVWHMLLYAWEMVHLQQRWNAAAEQAPSLDALLATVLTDLIQHRLRIGLARDYRTNCDEIPGVRGRVDFNESLKRTSFQHGRAFCRYQIYSGNVTKNQIVRSTLARLVQTGNFGSHKKKADELRLRLRRVVWEMDGIDIIELKPSSVRREQLQRHDADYRLMLAICHLILSRFMPTESIGAAGAPSTDREAYRLFDIYEKFVARFFRLRLKGWIVRQQAVLYWPAKEPSQLLPAMKPDLVLKHKATGELIVLDTKFTAKLFSSSQHGSKHFSRDHLFQIYAYLKSQEHQSPQHGTASGVLLYPTVMNPVHESVTIQNHAIHWETVDLAQPWEQIESELLDIPLSILKSLSQN